MQPQDPSSSPRPLFPVSSPLTSIASSSSSDSPLISRPGKKRRRESSGPQKCVYRAQIFASAGEITREVKVVRTREQRDEKVGVQAILRTGTTEVGMLHSKENWACWSCGEKSTRLRTRHTKVSGISGTFDILAWVFPLCSSNHACEAEAVECLEAIESDIAHSPEEEDFRARERESQIEAWRVGIVHLLERDRKSCGAAGCGKEAKDDGDGLDECSACRKICYCSAECQWSDWKSTHKYECLLHRDSPFRGIEAGHPNLSNLSIPMHLSGSDISHLLFLWVMHHHALLVLAVSSKLVSERSPTALLHILVAIPSCQTLALETLERLSNEPRPIFYPVTWETIDFEKLREEKDALLMLLKERAASGSKCVMVQLERSAARVAVWVRRNEIEVSMNLSEKLGPDGVWELLEWESRCRGCEREDEIFYDAISPCRS